MVRTSRWAHVVRLDIEMTQDDLANQRADWNMSEGGVLTVPWECGFFSLYGRQSNTPKSNRTDRRTPTSSKRGWDRLAYNMAMLPYILLLSSIYEPLPAVSGHVKLWPISLHLLEGWHGKHTALLCFGLQSHAYPASDCSVLIKSAFSLPRQSHVSRFNALFFKTVVTCLFFFICMLQDWTLTTAVSWTCDINALKHFQFSSIHLLHTIGSLMGVRKHESTGKEIICSGM